MQSNDEAASKEEEHESNDRLEEEEENVVKFIRLPLNTLMSRPKDVRIPLYILYIIYHRVGRPYK